MRQGRHSVIPACGQGRSPARRHVGLAFLFWCLAAVEPFTQVAFAQVPSRPRTGTASPTPARLSELSAVLASGRFSPVDLDAIWDNRSRLHASLGQFAKSLPEIAERYAVLYRVAQLLGYTGHFVLNKAPPSMRAEAFSLGYQIAQRAVELEPRRVEGHYWYAVNLSGFAVTQGVWQVWMQGHKILTALDAAVAAEPRYFFAGPLRARGMLYMKMPLQPFSVGSESRGLADLRQAVAVNPDVRLNRLSLGQALAATGASEPARRELEKGRSLPESMGPAEEAMVTSRFLELERTLSP